MELKLLGMVRKINELKLILINMKANFIEIAPNEFKFYFMRKKFMLIENPIGVYGQGRAVILYKLNGVIKNHIKTIGWTRSDNHGGLRNTDALLFGIVTIEQCKEASLKYLKELLS